jgi:hypothetical protein
MHRALLISLSIVVVVAIPLNSATASPRTVPIYQPDAFIGTIGLHLYDTDATTYMQSKKHLDPGTTFVSRVSMGNDGNTDDSFAVLGGSSQKPYKITYWSGKTDITSQVVAGTYVTGTIAPAASEMIKIKFKISANAKPYSGITTPLTLTSQGDSTVDAVSVCLWTKTH